MWCLHPLLLQLKRHGATFLLFWLASSVVMDRSYTILSMAALWQHCDSTWLAAVADNDKLHETLHLEASACVIWGAVGFIKSDNA